MWGDNASPKWICSIEERPAICSEATEVADICIEGQAELTICHCREILYTAAATAAAALLLQPLLSTATTAIVIAAP